MCKTISNNGKVLLGGLIFVTMLAACALEDAEMKELQDRAEDAFTAVTGVTLNYNELYMNVGEKQNIIASVQPVYASNKLVKWESTNVNVAAITATGIGDVVTINAVSPGTAVILVTTKEGGRSAACTVIVNDPSMPALTGTVTIDNTEPKAGETLTASYIPGNGSGNAVWQWLRNSELIDPGIASSSSYTASASDIGMALTARVMYSGNSGLIASDPTAPVAPSDTGGLKPGLYAKAPPVLESDIPVASVAANDIAAAVYYVNVNPAEYTLLLDKDVEADAQTLFGAYVSLNIIGIGGERRITQNSDIGYFLVINADGASLTIGENITFTGITGSGDTLIAVATGSLTMLAGSKISGNVTSSPFGVVSVRGSHSRFYMEGGEITGNITSDSGTTAVGGVYVTDGGEFNMSGGRVSGNSSALNGSSNADVYVRRYSSFVLTGAAEIGALIMGAESLGNARVIINSAFTGTVDALHLCGGIDNMGTTLYYWANALVIEAQEGHTLTAGEIDKFTLGEFRSSVASDTRPISGNPSGTSNYQIELEDGYGWLRMIAEPVLTGISVLSAPNKTQYLTGEELDLTGLEVRADFSDGSQITIDNNDLDISGYDSGYVGEQAVTISYAVNGVAKTATFEVTVAGSALQTQPGLYAKAPPVLASDARVSAVAANDFDAALDYVRDNPGAYTLLLSGNVEAGPHYLDASGISLTIAGIGGERTITYNSDLSAGGTYIVNFNSYNGSLTLGQNISLKTVKTSSLVRVGSGVFIMQDGSKINGNTILGPQGVVHLDGGSFTMEGGEIGGNLITWTGTSDITTGGVYMTGGGTFTMKGGSITGNTSAQFASGPADVYIGPNSPFVISGSAAIGSIVFDADVAGTANSIVKVAGAYSGSVGALNFRGNSASLAAVAVYWEDRAVIVPDYGYTLEQADINKFALGEFRSSAASGNAQPINGNSVSSGLPNYQIKFEGGAGILREIEPL